MEIRFVGGPLDGQVKEFNLPLTNMAFIVDNHEGKYWQHGPAYYWVTRHAKAPHPVRLGYRLAAMRTLTHTDRVNTRLVRELAKNARMNGYVLDLDSLIFETDPESGYVSVEVLAGERERESGS